MAREGKRVRTEHLEFRAVASPLPHPRVGLIVPKYSQSSVSRNRLKRRLRELARVHVLPVLPPVDVVIRSRREAYETSFDVLAAEVSHGVNALLGRFGNR
ncbi:MAG: ribonuclease P protein component [Steroidobacteraceae bacterium]